MHLQEAPHDEAKLVRCTRGALFDVCVDLRPGSVTFGRWIGAELTAENGRMLYVPPLCAHGYQTLTDESDVYYMTSAFYDASAVRGVRYDDPSVDIRWPLPPAGVSAQDAAWPFLAQWSRRGSA
jgi:dTDP-4-dehydrorhamnose 3,5-epimerase